MDVMTLKLHSCTPRDNPFMTWQLGHWPCFDPRQSVLHKAVIDQLVSWFDAKFGRLHWYDESVCSDALISCACEWQFCVFSLSTDVDMCLITVR